MTRSDYILSVKAKLDEISPFDEPDSFIASGGDTTYETVKPIVSYIGDCLDKAAWYCLNNLPISLLGADFEQEDYKATIDSYGVGHLEWADGYRRFVRLKDKSGAWKRDVTSFITTADPIYLLQQDPYTRGKYAKPVVAYSPETSELELYSFPCGNGKGCKCCTNVQLTYIDCTKVVENVQSPISDFIALVCAAYVEEILGDANAAAVFQKEYNNKIETILQ